MMVISSLLACPKVYIKPHKQIQFLFFRAEKTENDCKTSQPNPNFNLFVLQNWRIQKSIVAGNVYGTGCPRKNFTLLSPSILGPY